MLEDAGERFGFPVESLPSVTLDDDGAGDAGGERVSSSAIRAALAAGDLRRAERLLGHPYFISGHVIHGSKLGRTIGFPTANILPHGHARDRQTALAGIFVVRVHGAADEPLPGVASVGVRPTVEDAGRVLLEVHLFDFAASLYGRRVRVEFLHKLRDEEKYDDVTRLTAAIAADARAARAWFGLAHDAANVDTRRDGAAVSATDRIS
jgi:riboflavin kinase/FMN adenylyltransferase